MTVPGVEIHDFHQHLKLESHYDTAYLEKDHARRIEIMDRNGIEKATVSPSSRFDITRGIDDVRRVNDLVAEYVTEYSDRFPAGFGFVDLRMRDASLEEIHRAVNSLGLRGICWHHMSIGTYINDQSTFDCLERLRELGGIALIHAHAESMWEAAWRIDPLAEAFPNVPIVVLSGLYGWSSNEQTLWMVKRHKNLFVDTVLFPVNLWIERIVKELGADRVLYGSDLVALPEESAYHLAASLCEIRASPYLSDEDKYLILAGNAKALLSLP